MNKEPNTGVINELIKFKEKYKDESKRTHTNISLNKEIMRIIRPYGFKRIRNHNLVYNLFLSVYRKTSLHIKYIK